MTPEKQEWGIPEWHIHLVKERQEYFKKNPDHVIDFDIAMDEIEHELQTTNYKNIRK
jgi:hypothetical protein